MNEQFRKKLERDLARTGIAESWSEIVTDETEVKIDRSDVDDNDIGIASDGTKYVKSLVFKYIAEKGLPMTQEIVDMTAKLFVASGDSYTKKEHKRITHFDYDNVDDDDFVAYLTYKIAEQLSKININNNFMDYSFDVIRDVRGGTDTEALSKALKYRSEFGWKLKTVFTNELGKNSFSMSMNGSSMGTNSTVDQVVLIFERPSYLTDEMARKIYNELKKDK